MKNNNSGIRIGNNNKISKSNIGHHSNKNDGKIKKEGFATSHPILTGVITSIVVGFFFLFSFWKDLVAIIEGLFK